MVNKIRKPKKPMKVGSTVARLAQSKAMGDEPVFSGVLSNVDLGRAFTWYGSERNIADARKYVEAYFKTKGNKKVGWIRSIPDSKFPLTAGWMARIIELGGILPENLDGRIEKRLQEAKNSKVVTIEKPEVKETTKKVVTIQDKIKSKVSAFLCEVEGLIDDDRSADLYDLMTKKQFPASHTSRIIDLIKPRRDELELVIKGKIKEGFSGYTKTELKNMLSCYDKWISDAQRYGNNGKVIRNIRKPKVVSVDKITKNIKYQVESKDFKVVSLKPAQIVGAAEVWLFNTRYGNLTVLRSADPKGMSFRASKIIGYDPNLSISKKVGRKAEHFVGQVFVRTRAKLKKLMDEANTKPGEPADRLNENTLILRVFKD